MALSQSLFTKKADGKSKWETVNVEHFSCWDNSNHKTTYHYFLAVATVIKRCYKSPRKAIHTPNLDTRVEVKKRSKSHFPLYRSLEQGGWGDNNKICRETSAEYHHINNGNMTYLKQNTVNNMILGVLSGILIYTVWRQLIRYSIQLEVTNPKASVSFNN